MGTRETIHTMEFKKEIVNATQLLILLCLLYWSLTWNMPTNYDSLRGEKHSKMKFKSNSQHADLIKKEFTSVSNKHDIILESIETVRCKGKRASSVSSTENNAVLPSFNEWKEQELSKQGINENPHDIINDKKKPKRRKLNYSSSKCGAKILASNPEAKHRLAVLNEKADEYMLNPCKAKSWFVIELCDTVEVTQIELANYELYSSSPQVFSVFWSDVFPTQSWNHLGIFEAKDQRTMQTFDLHAKNLGKFIKVIISSHHGKEHYCPLSVIRILGYSMVYDFEETESVEEKADGWGKLNKTNSTFPEQSLKKLPRNEISNISLTLDGRYNLSRARNNQSSGKDNKHKKIHPLFLKYCKNFARKEETNKCSNLPSCRLLNKIILLKDAFTLANDYFGRQEAIKEPAEFELFQKQCSRITKFPVSKKHYVTNNTLNAQHKDHKAVYSSPNTYTRMTQSNQVIYPTIVYETNDNRRNKSETLNEGNPIVLEEWRQGKNELEKKISTDKKIKDFQTAGKISFSVSQNKQCVCKEDEEKDYNKNNINDNDDQSLDELDPSRLEDGIDSAGLIQKESVLIKLTSRIKGSELNLDLINKYLQQISQSYVQQMEDMKIMFNQTFKAMNIASEKADIIDNQQQDDLKLLERRVNSLSNKVEYLIGGHKSLLKTVVELHAFFLILEFIIISTIFTLFLHSFQQKCSVTRRRKFNLIYDKNFKFGPK